MSPYARMLFVKSPDSASVKGAALILLVCATLGASPTPTDAQEGETSVGSNEDVSARAAFQRGLDLLATDTPRAAASAFELALARGYRPPEEAYLKLGLAYQQVPLRKLDAIRAFRSALQASPPALEALYQFAGTYLVLDGWEAQREARRALLEILERDPFYRDAYDRWQALYPNEGEQRRLARALERMEHASDPFLVARVAALYLQLNERDDLERLLSSWRNRGGEESAGYHYYTARLLFLRGLEAEATASFQAGLEAVRESRDLEPFWADLAPLLGPEDREVAELRSLGGEVAFVRAFWEARDPLPFSAANERMAEQYRRVEQARKRYLWKKPLAKEKVIGHYVDDLGRPSFDTRLEGRSLDDRGTVYLRHGEPDVRHVEVGGGEYWRYDRPGLPGERLQFHFKLMEGPLARGNDTVYSILPTTDVGAANTRLGHAGQEGVENTLLGLGTDSYAFDPGVATVPLATAAATFRSREDRSRTEALLAVAAPLERLRLAAGPSLRLVQRLKLYDAEYRSELELSDTLDVPAESGTGTLVAAFQVSDLPGERRYAVQLETVPAAAVGVQRGELTLPSYAARGLQLSDVLFASRVGPAAADPSAPEREGLAIRPLLNRGLDRSQPLHLYYEIYDLAAGADTRARYRVEYGVSTEGGVEPSLLARVFGRADVVGEEDRVALAFERERPGPAERAAETISLDLSALPPGRYRVEVAVRDLVSGTETARVVVLDLLEGEGSSGMNEDATGEEEGASGAEEGAFGGEQVPSDGEQPPPGEGEEP